MPRLSYYLEMSRRMRSWRAAPKIFNYLKFRGLPRRAMTPTRRYTPQIASLLVTMRCNLNCSYCVAANILHDGRKNLPDSEATMEKIQRLFNNPLLGNCLLVELMGGEPLLVKDVDRIVAYLAQRGHIVDTSTNGMLLADRIADLKRAGIARINISLYEANRTLLEGNLERINQIFPVHTSMVLLRSMVEEQPDAMIERARFVRNAGCLSLRFFMYRPLGEHPQPQEIIDDSLPAYREFRRRMEEALPGFCFWPAAVKSPPVKKLCPQLWQRLTCDMTGRVQICCGTDAMLQGPNSNLLHDDPDAVFNHPTLVAMRKRLLDPAAEPPEICKNCNLLGEPGW